MLIAAYAGCGKTTAAQRLGLLDLPSMPYRWLLPYQETDSRSQADFEREKGALHHIEDPRFPQNYISDILQLEGWGNTVIFPTIVSVINTLVEKFGRTVYVVDPEDGLKEEYRQRYLARGNSDSFLHIFADSWEERMEEIKASKGIHLRLKSGEYLETLAAELLRQDQVKPIPVPVSILIELELEMQGLVRDLVLWMQGLEGCYAFPVGCVDHPATREFLERVGRAAYDGGPPRIELYPKQLVQELERCKHGSVTWLDGQEQFFEAVEREAKFRILSGWRTN